MASAKSVSRWEDAKFGGFERVVYDYPSIEMSWRFGYNLSSEMIKLRRYECQKLCDMFILNIKQHDLFEELVRNCKYEKVKIYRIEKTIISFDKASVETCLLNLISSEKCELSALFEHYQDFLKNTQFFFELPDKNFSENSLPENVSYEDISTFERLLRKVDIRKSWVEYGRSKGIEGIKGLKEETEFKFAEEQFTVCRYTPEETIDSDALLNLLDISFESKPDVIDSLRAGKLSGHKIAEIPAGNFHVYHRVEEDQSTRPFSICILCDESGSMKGQSRYYKQHSLVKTLYRAFSRIIPENKIFVYGHTGEEYPEIEVYHEPNYTKFEKTIDGQLHKIYMQNYDGPVIDCIYERVRGFTSDNIIFISISDGEPAGHEYGGEEAIADLKKVIEKCRRDGFVTVGIGIGEDSPVQYIYQYYTIINDDDSSCVPNVSRLINFVVRTEFKS